VRLRGAVRLVLVAAGFTAVAAVVLHPIFPDIGTRIVAAHWPILNAAILHGTPGRAVHGCVVDAPFFYPSLGVAAFTENLTGLWPVATPIM
jgi:hypothetical protein